MILSISLDCFVGFLDFCPVSVILTVRDLVQKMTSFRAFSLSAWSLLLSQRPDLLQPSSHILRVPFTRNQQGTMEMRHEVLSTVGAQNMDTSGYQVSNLEDIEFQFQDPDLNLDTVFPPGIDTLFHPELSTVSRWVQKLKTPI